MRVKLTTTDQSGHLTLGETYTVVEVYDDDVRVVTDDGGPSLFLASLFEVVDAREPENWETDIDRDGVVSKGPRACLLPGFFEDVWDGRPQALQVFVAEAGMDAAEAQRFQQWVRRPEARGPATPDLSE